MKKEYKKPAYLLDDDILLSGYVSKKRFYPQDGIQCGFGYQIIKKKDINKILFYSKEAIEKAGLSNIEIVYN